MITVVYHSADFDGLFSGAVFHHFLQPAEQEFRLIGWDFGDPLIKVSPTDRVMVVDLPLSCLDGPLSSVVLWIDHHKTALDRVEWQSAWGIRIDGVAACRLAWHWFDHELYEDFPERVPTKDSFVNREINGEPDVLRLVGEYDVWDKRDPDAEALQFGLTANGPWTPERIATTFFEKNIMPDITVKAVVVDGRAAMQWQQAFASDVCANRGYMVEFHGLKFWTLASVHTRNSMWFPNDSVPAEADALMCYRIIGDGSVSVSLYHAEGREHHDLSIIAGLRNGGGHRGACGFSLGLTQAIELGVIR